ncbi:MAG: hypothetical protein FWC00_05485 [Firmicutes bacterium]|nr:hypothetical protein [Bacillota bacterium]
MTDIERREELEKTLYENQQKRAKEKAEFDSLPPWMQKTELAKKKQAEMEKNNPAYKVAREKKEDDARCAEEKRTEEIKADPYSYIKIQEEKTQINPELLRKKYVSHMMKKEMALQKQINLAEKEKKGIITVSSMKHRLSEMQAERSKLYDSGELNYLMEKEAQKIIAFRELEKAYKQLNPFAKVAEKMKVRGVLDGEKLKGKDLLDKKFVMDHVDIDRDKLNFMQRDIEERGM